MMNHVWDRKGWVGDPYYQILITVFQLASSKKLILRADLFPQVGEAVIGPEIHKEVLLPAMKGKKGEMLIAKQYYSALTKCSCLSGTSTQAELSIYQCIRKCRDQDNQK